MSQVPQQKQRKFYPCRRNCGTQVTFDNAHKNPDGSKFVPLIVNSVGQLEAHQCPNRKQPQQQQAQQASPTDVVATAAVQSRTDSSSTNNDVVEIKTLLLQILRRIDFLEQRLVSHQK